MPNPNYKLISATGSYPVATDWIAAPTNLTCLVYLESGVTATYGLQWTLDDLQSNPAPRWFSDPGIPAGSTGTIMMSNINYPVTWVQLVVTAIAGGSLEFKVLEAVPPS